ncbi:thioredoxin family protein [Flavobacterium aurantiibacter]|uniref:Thioredoxin n=1 Tax=Flavobacterium aurantiibacter TaxID=2023067 RepID=A0A255ZN42_9FLAO|nr:thioredoxin family protein [Flavobacterium aurantiibacter]OYQ42305.1 thioredoxin [Flavobacterium aurantiibacter]
MKKILLFGFLMVSFLGMSQDVKWLTLEEALVAQQKNPKPIFMDVYTTWCGPCKMLDKNTFVDPSVTAIINEKYYAVKFNAEGNDEVNFKGETYSNPGYDPNKKGRNSQHQFAQFLKVPGYPSMVIISPAGEIKETIVGYHTPENLIARIK